MRKRGATTKHRARGHVLTPAQVQKLILPAHIALTLLPLGAFRESHAHDLAVLLNAVQFAADDAGRDDIHTHAYDAAVILVRMKERAEKCGSWNVTSAERVDLERHIVVIDRWLRRVSSSRLATALRRVQVACDRMTAEGRKPMESVDIPRANAPVLNRTEISRD